MPDPKPQQDLTARIARLEALVAELREELDHQREELEARPDLSPEALRLLETDALDMMEACGVTLQVARVLVALYASPRVVPSRVLEAAGWPDTPDPPLEGLKVAMSKARKALGPRSIECVWGVGYRLSPPARALVQARLAALAQRVA